MKLVSLYNPWILVSFLSDIGWHFQSNRLIACKCFTITTTHQFYFLLKRLEAKVDHLKMKLRKLMGPHGEIRIQTIVIITLVSYIIEQLQLRGMIKTGSGTLNLFLEATFDLINKM